VTHQRTVAYQRGNGWSILDELTGRGSHKVESFIHFAPDLRLVSASQGGLSVVDDGTGRGVAEISLPHGLEFEVLKGQYFPEFGVCEVNEVVRLYGEVTLPFRAEYRIQAIRLEVR
jgi:hypothetical protein